MSPIFRNPPPLEIVLQVLEAFGLTKGLNDSSWFSKASIKLDALEKVLIELEPYYMPCKAELYLYSTLTHLTAITILRQVIKPYGVSLKMKERGRYSVKTLWYHLSFDKETKGGAGEESFGTIDFS